MTRKAAMWVVGGLIVAGFLFALFREGTPTVARAEHVATAFSPLATLVTAAALFVGFRQLDVQREELALQRQEMRESRAELAKTAAAQQDLADATRDAVVAQRLSNDRGLQLVEAQLVQAVASLRVGIASADAARIQGASSPNGMRFNPRSDEFDVELRQTLQYVLSMLEGTREVMRGERDE